MNCLVRARSRFERQSLDQTQSDELGLRFASFTCG